MFGGQAQGFTQTKRISLEDRIVGGAAFALVGSQNHMCVLLAQDFREHLIGRQDADARINHEQTDIGHFHGPFR